MTDKAKMDHSPIRGDVIFNNGDYEEVVLLVLQGWDCHRMTVYVKNKYEMKINLACLTKWNSRYFGKGIISLASIKSIDQTIPLEKHKSGHKIEYKTPSQFVSWMITIHHSLISKASLSKPQQVIFNRLQTIFQWRDDQLHKLIQDRAKKIQDTLVQCIVKAAVNHNKNSIEMLQQFSTSVCPENNENS